MFIWKSTIETARKARAAPECICKQFKTAEMSTG